MNILSGEYRTLACCIMLLGPAFAGAQADTSKREVLVVSGGVTASLTSTSHAAGARLIVGRPYGRRQREFMLNVANVTLDRAAPTDRVGAGFHVEAFFGQNAAVVKSAGLDLGANADLFQAFATFTVAHGAHSYLQLKAGKIATLMGLEVAEDALNPNLEVGLQFAFAEPFTETGAQLEGHAGGHVDLELRVSNGWDQVADANTAKSWVARVGITPTERTLIALLGYAGAERADSTGPKRIGTQLLFTQKFGRVGAVSAQLDYGREDGLGAAGRDATWWGNGLWVTMGLGGSASLAVRGDYLDDRDGARTSGILGFAANGGQKLSSLTATLNITPWEHGMLRPEIRFDHSSLPAFAGHQGQVSFAFGVSYLF